MLRWSGLSGFGRRLAQRLQQVDLDRPTHRAQRQIVDFIGERIDQIVADRQHRQKHQPGDGRPERRRIAQRLDQPDRQEDAEQVGEQHREEAILVRKRRVLEPLHPALRVRYVHHHPLERRLLDGVDPAMGARLLDPHTHAFDHAIGDVGPLQRFLRRAIGQIAFDSLVHRLATQLAAQGVNISDLPKNDLPPDLLGLRVRQIGLGCAGEAAAGVDHLPPQAAPFPPALISGVAAKAEEQREGRTEQGQRQSRRFERKDIISDGDDHVP